MKMLNPALIAPVESIAAVLELPPIIVAEAMAIGLTELDIGIDQGRMLVECDDDPEPRWPASTLN